MPAGYNTGSGTGYPRDRTAETGREDVEKFHGNGDSTATFREPALALSSLCMLNI